MRRRLGSPLGFQNAERLTLWARTEESCTVLALTAKMFAIIGVTDRSMEDAVRGTQVCGDRCGSAPAVFVPPRADASLSPFQSINAACRPGQ